MKSQFLIIVNVNTIETAVEENHFSEVGPDTRKDLGYTLLRNGVDWLVIGVYETEEEARIEMNKMDATYECR